MKKILEGIAFGFVIVMILLALHSVGYAGTLTVSRDGDVNTVHYNGDVSAGDADALQRYIDMYEPATITLTSPGGLAQEGYRLGYVLMDYTGTVVVDKACMSACAVAFLGAPNKKIEGVLGFHPAWTTADMEPSDAMKAGQVMGLQTAMYMDITGYTLQFAYVFTVLASQDVFFIFQDLDDLERFKGGATDFVELTPMYLAGHMAGTERLSLIRRSYM